LRTSPPASGTSTPGSRTSRGSRSSKEYVLSPFLRPFSTSFFSFPLSVAQLLLLLFHLNHMRAQQYHTQPLSSS
jgi:hypothetical protein